MFATTLGTIAAVLSIVQYGPYIADTLRGKTKPHAFSWFIWGAPAGVVFLAQIIEGGGAGSWATGATAFICTGIFLLALTYGEPSITRFDWACLLSSLIAIILWFVTNDPLWAVVLVTAADLVAFGPTIRKSFDKPYEETLSTYVISGVKWLLSLSALAVLNPTTLLYPAAMVLGNWGYAAFLLLRRTQMRE